MGGGEGEGEFSCSFVSQGIMSIPAILNAFGRSGILLAVRKDSGQAGMTEKKNEFRENSP